MTQDELEDYCTNLGKALINVNELLERQNKLNHIHNEHIVFLLQQNKVLAGKLANLQARFN